jgi:oxygen-independent coproporphyrinogen-3 oxidase
MSPSQRPPVSAAELLQHDKPAPRYTSYPTAASFHADVDAAQYAERLARAAQKRTEALGLYVHLPFCDTKCTFCGCTMVVSRRHDRMADYTEHLCQEIRRVAAALGARRAVAQLHFGGGTPNHLPASLFARIWEQLWSSFERREPAEISIEVDPRVGSAEQIAQFGAMGFNRISFGVQDFSDEVQEQIHRRQSAEAAEECFHAARAAGFGGINLDLVYGLPGQSVDSFLYSVEKTLSLRPDRIALFSFAYVPWLKPHQKSIPPASLPSPFAKLSIYFAARERFLAAGYAQIGMDHFALPDDELARALRRGELRRNFQGYTVLPGSDSIGLGMSAIGDVAGAYVQNDPGIQSYEERIQEGGLATYRGYLRSNEDELRRDVIHRILCSFGLDYGSVEEDWKIDFRRHFSAALEALQQLAEDGLVDLDATGFRATELGKLLIRIVAMPFDAHLQKVQSSSPQTFSRSV